MFQVVHTGLLPQICRNLRIGPPLHVGKLSRNADLQIRAFRCTAALEKTCRAPVNLCGKPESLWNKYVQASWKIASVPGKETDTGRRHNGPHCAPAGFDEGRNGS